MSDYEARKSLTYANRFLLLPSSKDTLKLRGSINFSMKSCTITLQNCYQGLPSKMYKKATVTDYKNIHLWRWSTYPYFLCPVNNGGYNILLLYDKFTYTKVRSMPLEISSVLDQDPWFIHKVNVYLSSCYLYLYLHVKSPSLDHFLWTVYLFFINTLIPVQFFFFKPTCTIGNSLPFP